MYVQNMASSKIYKSDIMGCFGLFFLVAMGSFFNFSSEGGFFTRTSLNKYGFRTTWEYRDRLV